MKRNRFVQLNMAAIAIAIAGCQDVSGPAEAPNQLRECFIEYGNWPGGVFTGATDTPLGCPVNLTFSGQIVRFNAQVSWTSSGYVQYGLVSLDAVNRNFVEMFHAYYPEWTQPGGAVTVQGWGQYAAGTGNNNNNAPQQDYLFFRFTRSSNGQPTNVGFYIPWQWQGFPLRVTGPTSVAPYTDFSMNADILDASMVPPISYAWTRNGDLLAYSSDYFMYPGSDMGVNHEFQLTATDSEGRTLTASHYVHTLSCIGEGCSEQ